MPLCPYAQMGAKKTEWMRALPPTWTVMMRGLQGVKSTSAGQEKSAGPAVVSASIATLVSLGLGVSMMKIATSDAVYTHRLIAEVSGCVGTHANRMMTARRQPAHPPFLDQAVSLCVMRQHDVPVDGSASKRTQSLRGQCVSLIVADSDAWVRGTAMWILGCVGTVIFHVESIARLANHAIEVDVLAWTVDA